MSKLSRACPGELCQNCPGQPGHAARRGGCGGHELHELHELHCAAAAVKYCPGGSPRFELDGRAMGIAAGFAELEVVVTTSLAEPVTRFELPSFSFAHELRLSAHTHRLSAHGRPCLTTLCADRLLCPVVVLAVAAHPVTTFELDGRAIFIVAGVTELEVAVTTCPAEPVARMDLPSST